jgi:localization factor PodJL
MKPGIPWSVKGIEPEAREAAKFAARRSGMTLGEWLNNVILEQAEPPQTQERYASAPVAPRSTAETALRLEDLAHQLARLTQREQDTAAALIYEQQHAPSVDSSVIDSLSARVDASERQTVDAFSAVNEKLNAITKQLNESQKVWSPQRPEDVPGYHALETALRSIVDHIEVSEKRTREHLGTMQDRLSHLSQKAASAPDDRVLQNAPVITRLETRINELAMRLERDDAASRQELPPLVQSHLAKLAERIEHVHQSSETAIQRAQTVAAQGARAELEDVESRIHTLLKDAQSSIEGAGAVGKLHGEIESLNQRIDDLRADTASERDLHALKAAIEQLSARVAQGPDLRPLADMERRLAELTQRIEQSRDMSGIGNQLGEIDNRIADLDRRLNSLVLHGGDSESLQVFEQHIINISDRLTAAEHQFGHIATLENSIKQLFDSMEQNRHLTREVAEDTVNRMADRLIQVNPAMSAARGPSPELIALEQGLAAVRASAEAADQRNQETLVALHETLEQIVNRLAEMEVGSAAEEAAEAPVAASQTLADFVPETPVLPDLPSLQPPPIQQRGQGPDVFGVPHAFSEPQLQPQLEPQAPVEAVAPVEPQPQTAAEPTAPLPTDDFIAAARRAAQAAAKHGPAVAAAGEAAKDKKSKRFGFSLPFRKTAKAEKPGALPEPPVFTAPNPPGPGLTIGDAVPGPKPEGRRSLFKRGAKAAKPPMPAKPDMAMPGQPQILPAPGAEKGSIAARRLPLIAAGLVLLAAVTAITFKQLAGTKQADPAGQTQSDTVAPAGGAPASVGEASPPTAAPDQAQPEASAAPADEAGADAPVNGATPAESTKTEPERSGALLTDDILTAALPAGKSDASLSAIIAEPARDMGAASAAAEIPGAEIVPRSLREAAGKGDPAAQFIVASRYLDGQTIQQDFTEAARWYQKAAAQGLAPAQYRLATLFERGKGVPLDMATARVWYERAAERGNVRAMHNVAVIYASVQSGSPDYAKAGRWFKAAADHGLKDSQYNYAVLLERGMGVQKNLGDALLWYKLAARQNDADAEKRAAALERTLSPATVSEIRDRLAKWQAAPADQKANVVAVTDQAWQTPEAAPLPAPILGTDPALSSGVNPVQKTQELLMKQGFNIGVPDGRMGARTANAIRLFEMQSGMKVTGQVSAALLEALEKATPPA